MRNRTLIYLFGIVVLCMTLLVVPLASAENPQPNPADEFVYLVLEDHVEIYSYAGNSLTVVVPDYIEGKPVTKVSLGNTYQSDRFRFVKRVVLPSTVVELGFNCFSQFEHLETVEGLENVQILGDNVFDGTAVKTAVFSEKLSVVGANAFSGSYMSLDTIVIPDTVDYGDYNFMFFTDLNEMRLIRGSGEAKLKLEDGILFSADGKKLIKIMPYRRSAFVEIPEGTEIIAPNICFENKYVTEIQYPASVNSFMSGSGLPNDAVADVYDGSFAHQYIANEIATSGYGRLRVIGQETETVHSIVQTVLAQTLRDGMTDTQKARALHDWICDNARYDYTLSKFDAADILVDGEGVCDAYTKAYCILLEAAGIESRRIECYLDVDGHAINGVLLDGKWYLVDCTNDDEGFGRPDELFCFDSYVFNQYYSGSLSIEANDITKYAPYTQGRMNRALAALQTGITAELNAGKESFYIVLNDGDSVNGPLIFALCSLIQQSQWQQNGQAVTIECSYTDEHGYFCQTNNGAGSEPVFQYREDEYGGLCITAYKGKENVVTIPSTLDGKPVTSLSETFKGNITLTKVVLPEGLKEIGLGTFFDCTNLEEINFVSSLKKIGNSAFANCFSLAQDIVLPEGLESIGSDAFATCASIRRVSIPGTVTFLGNDVFFYCSSLRQVVLGEGVSALPDGMFVHCSRLKQLTLPNSLTKVGNGVFTYSGVVSLHIPANVSEITWGAFVYADCLESLTVDANNACFRAEGNVIFSKDGKRLVMAAGNVAASYTIPNGVETVAQYAFGMNKTVKRLTIPSSVKEIEKAAFMNTVIEHISIQEGLLRIGEYAFASYNTMTNGYVELYMQSGSLLSIHLPESLQSIGEGALFGNYRLKELFLPASVTSFSVPIINYPQEIYIPASVEYIAEQPMDSDWGENIVHGLAGTYAEEYAHQYGYEFVNEAGTLTLSLPELNLIPLETVSLHAVALNGQAAQIPDGDIQWESSASCVSVENGQVSVLSAGDAVVTARYGQYTGTCKVHVYDIPDDYRLPEDQYDGDNGMIVVLGEPVYRFTDMGYLLYETREDGTVDSVVISLTSHIQWSVSDDKLLSVNDKGEITALAPGVCTVYARLPNGNTTEYLFTILGKTVATEMSAMDQLFECRHRAMIPAGTDVIEAEAFSGCGFEAAVIPEGCQRIGAFAFAASASLKFVHIPSTVLDIGENAFSGCPQIVLIVRNEYAAQYAENAGITYEWDK